VVKFCLKQAQSGEMIEHCEKFYHYIQLITPKGIVNAKWREQFVKRGERLI